MAELAPHSHILTDAAPDGLTFVELAEKTKLEPAVLAEMTSIGVANGHVRMVETHYSPG